MLEQKEKNHILLRNKEGRVFPDEIVKQLPYIPAGAPLHKEWRSRQLSYERLLSYLAKRTNPLKILELGCRNGWLCARLASDGHFCTGVDVNKTELEQAARVFEHQNLNFVYANIEDKPKLGKFNIIIMNASIQYFPSLKDILSLLIEYLSEKGEIIIMDSFLYSQRGLSMARNRSDIYFGKMQVPEMSKFYFHHSKNSLKHFNYQYIYKPNNKILSLIFGSPQSIFPIISIKATVKK